ncbi:MAG: SDR family NAD(P)-dependent oxidoreductase [Pseudomonadales bacterium]
MAFSNFNGKTVIITGASAGVGAACARAFAKQGAKLVIAARGEEALEKIAAELREQTEVLSMAMDVADAEACERLVQKSIETFGAVHVLVNNAGVHRRGEVISRSAADLMAMVDINLRAPLQLTAEVLPAMKEQGEGAIVMVGSLAGRAPLQGAATYAGTKAGLRAFSYALADEVRDDNIAVGVVSPGPIDTGFIMDEIDAVEDIVYSQPMSSAEQVADAVLSLARGEALEISMPAASGFLTTLSYLFPRLRRVSRPLLYKIGRKNKEKYRVRGV